MPQEIDFDIPAPTGISPDLAATRRRNLAWVRRIGLVRDGDALDWYTSWDMPGLAALGYPHARGAALDLCADTMAFFFVFDDQFDGPLGHDPAAANRACRRLIDVVRGTPTPASREPDPCTAAFADIWHRALHHAPPGWAARAAHEWEYYFATHPHEAINRRRGTPGDMEHHLHVRRGIAGTILPLSLGEHAARITVPPAAHHSPHLRIMRELAIDVTLMANDVYSLEKEEARGDMDNLVLVLQHTHALTRDKALTAATEEIDHRCARFRDLASRVPAMADELGLTGAQRTAVDTYVDVMSAWMSGYHAWQTRTARYRDALHVLPDTGPGHHDEVLRA
ncbi:terpene cyclase [Embleya sp. NPDC050154]|uniref:terpene synthase family protein n=1 Tax=Embleya sp. NPDC050154 TaxID=3363988 RepID=UPI00378CBB10